MAKLNDADDNVLSILHDHGPCSFTNAADLSSVEKMLKSGHIVAIGHNDVEITPKGLRWLNTH